MLLFVWVGVLTCLNTDYCCVGNYSKEMGNNHWPQIPMRVQYTVCRLQYNLQLCVSESSSISVLSRLFENQHRQNDWIYIQSQTKWGQIYPFHCTHSVKQTDYINIKSHVLLPKSAKINWNTSSAEEVQKHYMQNTRFIFKKPFRRLARFQIDKGQKFLTEMVKIC